MFGKGFDYYIARLFTNVHLDVKYSTDLREVLKVICELCGMSFTMRERFTCYR